MPIIGQLAQQGIDSRLYWKNEDIGLNASIVPTSAITGEGLSDLLGYLVYYAQS